MRDDSEVELEIEDCQSEDREAGESDGMGRVKAVVFPQQQPWGSKNYTQHTGNK